MNEKQRLEAEMYALMNRLCSNTSDIGDWKINKIYEYRMMGLEDPYDFEALAEERQAVRDEINRLQQQISSMTDEIEDIEAEG